MGLSATATTARRLGQMWRPTAAHYLSRSGALLISTINNGGDLGECLKGRSPPVMHLKGYNYRRANHRWVYFNGVLDQAPFGVDSR